MDTFGSKLQQKALQQPKQKKSKSAEFLMGREARANVVGIENPAFDGERSTERSIPPVWLGREIRGDRPDSTLAAHQKKMEPRAPAKERVSSFPFGGPLVPAFQSKRVLTSNPRITSSFAGERYSRNERAQNYFDPSSTRQTDSGHCRTTGVSAEDELELKTFTADEKKLYERITALLDDEDTFIDLPGTLLASRDEEVLEVKAGDLVLQRRLLLHSGGDASGSRPSQAHTIAKTQAEGSTELGGEAGLEAGRMVMGRESTVKMRTAEEVIPHYTQQLKERVRPDMIMLGSLSLQQQVAQNGPPKRSEWAKRKKRLMAFFTGDFKEPGSQRDSDEAVRPQPMMNTLLQCSDIESPSLRALGEGQEEAMAKYSQMTELPESSSAASRPLWQADQKTAFQPVEVCVRCLRAMRDRLPRGLYTVRVALHSHLGGPALAWCSKKGQHVWAAFTEPTEHRGRFYDIDLHINQSLFMVLPATCNIIPSMVLVFQLITAPGDRSHVSCALAWAAFPACGPSLGLIEGRFKTPLIRGEPSTQLDQFKKIEALISSDLDHWLCNLYFQVKRLPPGASRGPEHCITLSIPSSKQPIIPQSEVHQNQLPLQPKPPSQHQLCPQLVHPQSQQQACTDPSCRAGDPTVVHSHRGSPLNLSADSACSSSSLPGKNFSSGAISGSTGEKSDPCREKAEGGNHYKKKPIKKTNSCGPSMSSRSAPPRHADKQKMQPSMENLSTEEMEEYTFSLQFHFHAHTVDLVYQSSLLHTREELAMVVVGPLTLNAITFLLVLIRWGCQQIFGSLPSFTSKFIMAQGVWTVLDPLAVFAVDAILGRLSYSPDTPVGDAAKLYWHFYQADKSGAAGVIITLFLYAVLFLLSITILSMYLLRLHNDGRMLDVFQRLTAKEGVYFLPQDLELSNQELSYIVKKAEQWRGFNGERRKVAVYDYILTTEDPVSDSAAPSDESHRDGAHMPEDETSTHVAVYTLHLSGLKQIYRHFLRQSDGAIIEVMGDIEGLDNASSTVPCPAQSSDKQREDKGGDALQLRKRKKRFWRSHRVEPVGGNRCDSSFALQDLNQ
uniref:Orofacial cleft 1 candidate gene 1 protein n=1 Tax=Oreochromis niloticus TaxID=8128 RepID=A0A669EIX4_ORENI